jgi:multidrug resistance efflux pump
MKEDKQASMGRSLRSGGSWRHAGDEWWRRWPVRTILVLSILLGGFLPYNHEISGDCRLVPAIQQGVRAQFSDEITGVMVSEGDWVEAGSVIAQQSARDVKAEIALTEAELIRVRAKLEQSKAGFLAEEIELAEHQALLLSSELSFQTQQVERQLALKQAGLTNDAEVDKAQRLRDAARYAKAAAESQLEKLQGGSRDEEIRAAYAQVTHYESILQKLRHDLDRTKLRAPISGNVVTPHVQDRIGQLAQKGDLILVIQDASRLYVQIAAYEEAAARVRKGMPVKVRVGALNGALFRGRVEGMAEEVDTQNLSDTLTVRSDRELFYQDTLERNREERLRVLAELDKADTQLMPGMTCKARIVVGEGFIGSALLRPVVRFLRTEAWSWLP